MEAKPRKKRRLIRAFLWLFAVGVVFLALQPVWFPWLLKPIVNRCGLSFDSYDRIGWSRFALTSVHGAWDDTALEVQRVESVLPTAWLWRRVINDSNRPPLLHIDGGQLTIGRAGTNVINADQQGSAGQLLSQISEVGRLLQRWLPAAKLTNCLIDIASNRVSIPQAEWRAGSLHADVGIISLKAEVGLFVQLDGDKAIEVGANWNAGNASVRGRFSRGDEVWRLTGDLDWLTNRAALTAELNMHSWWPAQAQINLQNWRIPTNGLQVENYEARVASGMVSLVSNRFELQVTGAAQPSGEAMRSGWPVASFSLGATGDPNGMKVHTLNIQSPWMSANLANTVNIALTGELLPEPAELRVSIDLAKWPGTPVTGNAAGVVRIESQKGKPPIARFTFSAGQIQAGNLEAESILVRGEFNAPILKLDEMHADLTDGSVLAANGSFDVAKRQVEAGHWKLSGGLLQKLLPGLSYVDFSATGEVNGSLTNLAHNGDVTLTSVQANGLKPMEIRARWGGANQHFEFAKAELTAGRSILSVDATADLELSRGGAAATLKQLSLRRSNDELFALLKPCAVKFRSGTANAPGVGWTLAMEAFDWRGDRRTVSAATALDWPSNGKAALAMTNVALADFSDFFDGDIANVSFDALSASAQWSNGPVRSVVALSGSLTNETGHVLGLRGEVRADEILKVQLSASASGYTSTLSVTGSVPVKVVPGRSESMLVWDKSEHMDLSGNWKDDQAKGFSIPLGRFGQLDVSQPTLNFRIAGTRELPLAELTAAATKLNWQSKTNPGLRPKLEEFQLTVDLRPDLIRLKSFTAKLDGQPLAATGVWPFSEEAWQKAWSDQTLPDWAGAHGHLELAQAQVSAVSAYLPEALAPEGHLSATVDLRTGKRIEGVLALTNAATRAMGPITPMRDIDALVRFDGHRAELQSFRGQIGGQPIRADAFVTIPEAHSDDFNYQINLSGTNVPLTRSAQLLLRGDFAVSLRGGSNLPPVVSGTVTLRDGLYVQHASALVWSAPRRPEWRPPYFSVTNDPFVDWKLNLTVRGDRFLRIRTPVFSGIASADFQLKGSLLNPIMIGDARVTSGRVYLPFGSLSIVQALASFSGNDLKGPDLQINAAGRNYRYDLRLEAKGQADGANILFSSTPPLTSEQILLMLTAGEVPQSEYAFSSGARAGRLATFLGSDLLSRYLGTDPGKERLVIQTGESISESGRLTYSVEYRLTDRWSIIGEYDEFSAFNTDVKWKAFRR